MTLSVSGTRPRLDGPGRHISVQEGVGGDRVRESKRVQPSGGVATEEVVLLCDIDGREDESGSRHRACTDPPRAAILCRPVEGDADDRDRQALEPASQDAAVGPHGIRDHEELGAVQVGVGELVIDQLYLIGKITTVSDSVSVVLLVSDENCRVAAKVEGSREQGIVSGERVTTGLTPLLNLNFLSKQADLKPGQKVYTSGVGGVFPSGLLIGSVKAFHVRELDGQAQLTPAVDLSHLEDVFVVTGRK